MNFLPSRSSSKKKCLDELCGGSYEFAHIVKAFHFDYRNRDTCEIRKYQHFSTIIAESSLVNTLKGGFNVPLDGVLESSTPLASLHVEFFNRETGTSLLLVGLREAT